MTYAELVEDCAGRLGGLRALARQLGVGHATFRERVKHPHRIKREHQLALELVHQRLTRGEATP